MKKYLILFLCLVFVSVPLISSASYYNYSDVLLVINDNSTISQEVGNYFINARTGLGLHVVHINTVSENAGNAVGDQIGLTEYTNNIATPISNYITQNNLSNTINYIVLTKGIPLRISDTNNSVDSTMASCLGNPSCSSISNPFRGTKKIFSHTDPLNNGIYLVTRLDGYVPTNNGCVVNNTTCFSNGDDISQITAIIDHSTIANILPVATLKSQGLFVLDGGTALGPIYNGDINSQLQAVNTILTNKGWSTNLELTNTYLTNQQNVLGYWSWGIHANEPTANHAIPGNTYEDGAIGETAVSYSGSTFKYAPTYSNGESLAADWIHEGISGMKGYVYEPYLGAVANPTVLFDNYTDGFNMADSFYSASAFIGWKDVVIGDPKMVILPIVSPNPTSAFPGGSINSTSPTLSWSQSQSNGGTILSYKLYIDGQLNKTLDGNTLSTTPASPLSGGSHAYYVKATDSLGNTGSGSALTFNVSQFSTFDLISPANGLVTSSPKQTFSWQIPTTTSNDTIFYRFYVNNVLIDGTIRKLNGGDTTINYDYTLPTNGTYNWYVEAFDTVTQTVVQTSLSTYKVIFKGLPCYQENADQATNANWASEPGSQANGTCGLIANTGAYSVEQGSTFLDYQYNPIGTDVSQIHDGIWDTWQQGNYDHNNGVYADSSNNNTDNYIDITYAIPPSATSDSYWIIQDDGSGGGQHSNGFIVNVSIPSSCWSYGVSHSNKLYFRVDSAQGATLNFDPWVGTPYYGTTWSCKDSNGWNIVASDELGGSGFITEEAMMWETLDTAAPTGGSIVYTNGYSNTTSVPLTADDGADATYGIDNTSRIFKRASAVLSNGTCGSFSGYSDITSSISGIYPNFTDGTTSFGNCYKYEYLVSNNAQNQATYTSNNIIEVSEPAQISSFDFASLSLTGIVNNTAHTVSLTVPYGTSINSLAPTIALSATGTISPTSGTAENFTTPQIYTVTAQDGVTTQQYMVTITTAAPIVSSGGGMPAAPSTQPQPQPQPQTTAQQIVVLQQQILQLQTLINKILAERGLNIQLTKDLKYGSFDPEVIILQNILKKLDILPQSTKSVKTFGLATLKAVKAFQLKYGILNSKSAQYGMVGPRTREKLNNLNK